MNLKNIINKKSVAAVGIGALLGATAYIINKKCGGKIMETTKKCAEAAKDVAKDVAEDITKEAVKEMVKETAKDIIDDSVVGKVLDNTETKIYLNVADALDSIMKPIESFATKAIDKVYERPLYVVATGTLVLGAIIVVGNIKVRKYDAEVRKYEAECNKKTSHPDYREYSFNKADEYDFGDRTLFQ